MTIPEKKAILNKCRELNDSINEELEKLARLKSLAVKVTPTLSLMPKVTSGDDRLQSSYEKIELQEKKIDRKIDLLVNLKIHLLYDIAMTTHDYETRLFPCRCMQFSNIPCNKAIRKHGG